MSSSVFWISLKVEGSDVFNDTSLEDVLAVSEVGLKYGNLNIEWETFHHEVKLIIMGEGRIVFGMFW